MQSLSVRVLGEFEIDGVEPYALGSRKGRALLRLLALARGQAVSADALASALWGDSLPSKPADQVAVLVSRLRGVVGGDRLEHTDAGYRLHYDWLDAETPRLGQRAKDILSRNWTSGKPESVVYLAWKLLERGTVDL